MKEFEIKHQKLIDDNTNKFTPEMTVVSEVPPVVKKEETTYKVELYNVYLKVLYNSKPGLQVVKLNPMMKKISNLSFLNWDNNNLIDDHVVPFLQNNCMPISIYLPRSQTVERYNSRTQNSFTNRNHPYSRTGAYRQILNRRNKSPYSQELCHYQNVLR